MIGLPFAGLRMLLVDIINTRDPTELPGRVARVPPSDHHRNPR